MKTSLHDRLRGSRRVRVAPDTGPMTGSTSNQQPSTIRGEAQPLSRLCDGRRSAERRFVRADAPLGRDVEARAQCPLWLDGRGQRSWLAARPCAES